MNGNMPRQDITADLEVMEQIGLGDVTTVNVDCGGPFRES